ncbi:MAG: hypothetical protein JJE39_17645 [Vicinamibacteria bacterium]|nr:hypothetical protein [Vicinamibacteria bacterium]
MTHGLTGGLLLASNLLMGVNWTKVSPEAALYMSATLSVVASLLLRFLVRETVGTPPLALN